MIEEQASQTRSNTVFASGIAFSKGRQDAERLIDQGAKIVSVDLFTGVVAFVPSDA